MHLNFAEVLICGGNKGGQYSVIPSIKCTDAFGLSICTSASLYDEAHRQVIQIIRNYF